MQNLSNLRVNSLAQMLSLAQKLFLKVINIGGGGDPLRLNKTPNNTHYPYKSAKQSFYTTIALSSLRDLLVSPAFALANSWQSTSLNNRLPRRLKSARNDDVGNLRFDLRICK